MLTGQRGIWRCSFITHSPILGMRGFPIERFATLLALNQSCDQAETWVKEKWVGAGFRVVPTFDLQVARSAHPECTCPHHGTDECNCQLVVLLVYGKPTDPATLVIHGQDGKTWISLATPIETGARQNLESSVRHILIHRYTDSLTPAEPVYGTQPTA